MKKRIFLAAFLVCTVLLLCSCSGGSSEYHTDKYKAGDFFIGGQTLTLYFWDNGDGSAEMDICDENGKAIQTIEFPERNDYYLSLSYSYAKQNIRAEDLNFDNYDDLYIPCSVTTPNLEGMCWLWNPDKKTLELSDELSRLPEVSALEALEQVQSYDNMAEDGPEINYYEWRDGVLELDKTAKTQERSNSGAAE